MTQKVSPWPVATAPGSDFADPQSKDFRAAIAVPAAATSNKC